MQLTFKTLVYLALPILVQAEYDALRQPQLDATTLITLPVTKQLPALRSSVSLRKNSPTLNVTTPDSISTTTLRVLQQNSTPQQLDNSAAAYLKCYSLLEDATTATNGIMTQTEYLSFLMLMTDGMINYNAFADLSAIYVMIFYNTACSISDCSPGNVPQIDIGNTDDPNDTIQFMCQQTLKTLTSTAETIFEYTIRYSTTAIDEDDLATCLSTATVNVLLDELANCPPITEVDVVNTRRTTRRQQQNSRHLQALGSAMTDENSMCDYQIVASVERFTELPCNPSIPGGMDGSVNERCGLVRSKAIVTAPQLYEPFSTLLRSQMVTILRTVIDNGSLTTFFPPGTCPIV